MNNGILTGYDDRINNSFFSTNRSLTYANYELGKNGTILGPQESTPPRNYSSGAGTRVVSSNHIGVPYINNGILNYNSEYSQNIDWDNSYVFVVDTASTFTQNPYYVYANESTAKIPHMLLGFGYRGVENAIVNWGDGQFENLNVATVNKTYRQHGVYIVQITPIGTNFGTSYNPIIDGRNDFRDGKVVGILSWPKRTTSLMTFQFWSRCDFVPSFIPTNVTSFNFAQSIGLLQNIELWDVSRLTSIFITYNNVFNRDLSKWVFNSELTSLSFIADSVFNNGESSGINNWNVSNFTSMSNMFNSCTRFNQPLDNWNVRKVTSFTSMFQGATNFNSSLSGWALGADTTGTTCLSMFQRASNFNQDLSNWNTSKVTTMASMFDTASSFNNAGNSGINNWNTSNVTNMSRMFYVTPFNQPIGNWDVSKVTDMNTMFYINYAFNQDIGNWNMVSVTNIGNMFGNAVGFNNGGSSSINNWNTSNITSMFQVFLNANSFNQPLNNWNTSNVANMSNMFQNATSFNQNLSSWNVRKVTNFSSMFNGATSFNSSLSGWALGADTAGANCASMFQGASSFVGSGLDSWDVSKINNMTYMFYNASSFNTNIGSWSVGHITSFDRMFAGAQSFNNGGSPSISGWNTGNVTNMSNMFLNNYNFNQPIGSWNVSKVTTMDLMLSAASVFQQDISTWNLAGLNATTSLDNFMLNKNGVNSYSTTNYDALLIGWNNNKLATANGVANWRTDLRPHFGQAKYTSGGAAATARAALVSYGWTITDGGVA